MSSSAQSLSLVFIELQKSKSVKPSNTLKAILDEVMRNPFEKESTFVKYFKLCQLVRDTRIEVEELFPDAPYLTSWMPNVEQNLIGTKINGRAADSLIWLNNQALQGAETCATLVEREVSREPISQDDLQRFYGEASNLFEEVKESSNLDDEVKEFLLKHLKDFISAIQDSWIMGVKPVKSAAANAFTEASLNPDIVEKVQATEVGRHFFKKVLYPLLFVVGLSADALTVTKALGVNIVPELSGEVLEETSKASNELPAPITDIDFEAIKEAE